MDSQKVAQADISGNHLLDFFFFFAEKFLGESCTDLLVGKGDPNNPEQAGRPYIGRYEEAPRYHQFNSHIKTGYRINYTTWP